MTAESTSLGYDLHLMLVNTVRDLASEGRNLVIVALVGTNLHIRIFDANGKRVVDKAENELMSGETLTTLKKQLNPLPDKSGLSQEQKQKIIQGATSIAGYTPSPSSRNTNITSLGEDKSTEEEILADLAAHIEDLNIVIHDLEASKPSLTLGLFGFALSLVLLIGAIALVVVPYFEPRVPLPVSNVAAFFVVIFAFALYLAYRTLSAEFERRRLHVSVYRRARYIYEAASHLFWSQYNDL